jgi:hypothetical protein
MMMTEVMLRENADELEEMSQEILNIVEDMERLLKGTGAIRERARAYWIAHIREAVSGRGTMCSIRDTVSEMREEAEYMFDDER